MSLTVKAHLYEEWANEPIETRRFALDQDVATNYTYLTEKLAQTFPQVKPQDITVSYLDTDGDRITVSSDDELTDALDQFDGTVFRLHIKKKSTTTDDEFNGPFVPPFLRYGGRHGPWSGRGRWNRPYPPGGRRWGCPFNPSAWQKSDNGCNPSTTTDSTKDECKPSTQPAPSDDQQAQPKDDQETQPTTAPTDSKEGPYHPGGSGGGQQYNPWAGLLGAGPFNFGPFGGTFELWGDQPRCGPFGQQGGHCGRWGGGPCQQNNKSEGADKMETSEGTSSAEPSSSEAFKDVMDQLKSMGIVDEGGWLYELVKAKGGDLQKILDALQPGQN